MIKMKMLMVASVASMIDQFNMSNIRILLDMGYEVDVACNFSEGSSCSEQKIEKLKVQLKEWKVNIHQVDFQRNVMDLKSHKTAYKQLLKLSNENHYSFIHCHSPIGGVIARLIAKKEKTKVIYTAHGFHFFKGAPFKNWIMFYPIEWLCSRWTDILITINTEDYHRALKSFHAGQIRYIPGVGVRTERFLSCEADREKMRKEIGIPQEAVVLLSVGEVSENKNHEIIIRALGKLNNKNIYYLICGKGELKTHLEKVAKELGIRKQIIFLGFRNDIPQLCSISDIFAFPSKREGLGLAALEGMASGLPLISSDIHGIKDYSVNGITGYTAASSDVDGFSKAIDELVKHPEIREKMKEENQNRAQKYDLKNVDKLMKKIYSEL